MYEYDNGLKSGAHKVMTVVFVLVAIGVIGACAKIVLDHISGDGTATSSSDTCIRDEEMSPLERAGIFGSARPRCEENAGDQKETKKATRANSTKK